MNTKTIFLVSAVVLASGCTSVLTSAGVVSDESPSINAANITVSQGENVSVNVGIETALVMGVADPNKVIERFGPEAANPAANNVTPRYSTENPEEMNSENVIGWIVEWQQTTNSTVDLPINTSKQPGVYRYSLVAVNKGKTSAINLQVNITE